MLSATVAQIIKEEAFPVILAGNCITAVGILSGLHNKKIGVLWLDAHADFNTPETTQSGYLDGMALSTACGYCWKSLAAKDPLYQAIVEDSVVLIGTRDVDPLEAKLLKQRRMRVFSVDNLRQSHCQLPKGTFADSKDIYVHFDADVLDASLGYANRFSSKGGFLPEEIVKLLSWAGANYNIAALAVTAYDPEYDKSGRARDEIREIVLAAINTVDSRRKSI